MDDYMKIKKVSNSKDSRMKVVAGIDKVADAVKSTMGPAGRLVLYSGDFGTMGITKDGVTVARNIKLADPEENMGAALIKQSANQTLKGAGDGTTTTCVLAQSLIHSGLSLMDSGENMINFTRQMRKVIEDTVIPSIRSMKVFLEDEEIIKTTTRMSTNDDPELSEVVSEIYSKYGKDVVVNVETSDNGKTETSIIPGISINRGYTRSAFAPLNDPVTKFENCGIILLDDKVTNPQLLTTKVIQPLYANPPLMPVIIIAKDFPEGFEADLLRNRANGIPILPIRAPYYGQKQKDYLRDIAKFTRAKVISDADGVPLNQADTSVVGTAEMVMVDMNSTTIINSKKPDDLDAYIEELKGSLDKTKSEYDKDNIKERISKLTAGICSIKVYADTDAELQEKKDRLDDALRAVKVALDKGLCPGGGSAFYYIQKSLRNSKDSAELAVAKALKEPMYQLIRNSGEIPEEILLDQNTYEDPCYDVNSKKFVSMTTTKILDPIGVLESSLKNALSIAIQVLSLGVVISDLPESEQSKSKENR